MKQQHVIDCFVWTLITLKAVAVMNTVINSVLSRLTTITLGGCVNSTRFYFNVGVGFEPVSFRPGVLYH